MYNSNNFLVDKQFGDKYEQFIARALGGQWNKTSGDDEGIDVIVNQYVDIDDNDKWLIDVKAYKKPLFKDDFDGFFIEVMTTTEKKQEKHAGWYLNPKKTNMFCLLKNCHQDEVKFAVCYLITPAELCEAVKEAQEDGYCKELSKCGNTEGYILPYKYVDKHCMLFTTYNNMKKEMMYYEDQRREN